MSIENTATQNSDGSPTLPDSFIAFTRERCTKCGERCRDRYLADGVCIGCRATEVTDD